MRGGDLRLFGVGSAGIDTIETPERTVTGVLGGSVIYYSLAAAKLARTGVVGVVGEDFSEEYRQLWAAHEVDLEGLEVVPGGRTFRWHGRYRENLDDRDTVATQLNVLGTFRPRVPAAYREAPFVFLANGAPAHGLEVLGQLAAGRHFVAADTMDLWIKTALPELQELISRVDCLLLNEAEARLLTGQFALLGAARELLRRGPRVVVVKKGSHGALLVSATDLFCAPCYPVAKLVDPTGAGDAFAGGFMGYLAREGKVGGDALRRAVVSGAAIASFAVESFSVAALLRAGPAEVESRFNALAEMSRVPPP